MFIPSFSGKRYTPFHYAMLSKGTKILYRLVRQSIMNCEKSLFLPGFTKKVDFCKILLNVMNDSPFIFWADNTVSTIITQDGTTVRFFYNNMASCKNSYLDLLIEKAEEYYRECVHEGDSDFDIALSVHDRLSASVVYDEDSAKVHNNEKAFFSRSHSLIGPLLFGKGVCEGISDAYTYLLSCMGVKTASVWGNIKGEAGMHAWNIVYLEHEWYHVDVTWDLSKGIHNSPVHFYFCLDDRMITESRTYSGYLPCNGRKFNYYLLNGTSFRNPKELKSFLLKLETGTTVEFHTEFELTDISAINGISVRILSADHHRHCATLI